MAYIKKGDPSFRKALIALFSGSFITFMIMYSVQTLFPVFSAEFDVSPAVASLSLSVTTGFLAVTMIAASYMSDSFGRKKIMSLSLILSAVLCLLTAFSFNFTYLLVIRALQGIALAGFPAVAMAYVSEEFHPRVLGVVMGIYVSGTTVGGLSGRMLTSFLTSYASWQTALFTMGVICLILSIWFWRALPTPVNSENSVSASSVNVLTAFTYNLKNRRIAALVLMPFLLMGGFVTMYNYLGFYLMESPYYLSQAAIGLIFGLYLMGTLSSTLMGRMSDLAGNNRILPLSILIMLAGVFTTLSTHLVLILAGLAIVTFGFFASHSIASNWIGELATAHRAQATSLYLLAYYLGSSIIGTAGGFVWYSTGWPGVVMLVSALAAVSLMLTAVVIKAGKQAAA